jgi:putative nucleotidyltransferase with HDIG domain
MEKIENFLKDLAVSLQVAKIYTIEHPNFNVAIEKTYASLSDILNYREELVLGLVGDELAFEKEIFFDLSKKLKYFIFSLKEKDIERIIFKQGINKDELARFMSYFVIPKKELRKSAEEYFLISGIKNIAVTKLGAASGSEKLNAAMNYITQYQEYLENIKQPFGDILAGKPLDYLDLRFTMVNIMQNLSGKHQELVALTAMKSHDTATFIHLLNVSILAIYFSSKLGLAKDDCLDIGIGALFHDIGKIQISKEIIQKPDKLTDPEFSKMKSHTVWGAQILLKYVDALGVLPAVVAFEHHLRYDKKGYPKLIFSQTPCAASLIVSICDVYDALTERRTYKRDYPPNLIYDLMMRDREKMFEPQLLDKFFKIMGVWPVGTIVALNNGEVAIVRKTNEDDIFSPLVEVVSGAVKKELIDLKAKAGTIKIDNSLNPLAEGKEYLSYIA